MDFDKQVTIINPVSCYGAGVHSGMAAQLTLKPAPKDTGIVFLRTDVKVGNNFIEAKYANVFNTSLCTTVRNDNKVEVSTIEHLLAAIYGCGIDNLIVEIDGPEVPIMDGSSKAFVFMIECAGRKIQDAQRKYLKILKDVKVVHKDCEIFCSPFSTFQMELTIDFPNKVIGRQNISYSDIASFNDSIADARTFGFVHELDYLRSKGLAKGASLDNAIGIENDIILNHNGLRYADEFVRHKLLDWVGDLRTASGGIIGSLNGYKTSHALNNEFLRILFSDAFAYEWVTRKSVPSTL